MSDLVVALNYWRDRISNGEMTAATVSRYHRVLTAFRRFTNVSGGPTAEVTTAICRAFIYAPLRGGAPPATSTSRFRLTVLRDASIAWLAAGLIDSDPTQGLRVAQAVQARAPFPLTPDEGSRLRVSGRLSPRDHQRPSVVELALAGGSHEEIARVVVDHVDLVRGRVYIGERWSILEPFAVATLTARIAACRRAVKASRRSWDPANVSIAMARPLADYSETSVAPGISSSLRRAMGAAGLNRPGLRPASIREFAANRVYARSGRVEDVAELLGLESLDVARGFVCLDWQARFGDEVRAR